MPAYTMTGPTTGLQQVASSNFTVTADGTTITTPVVVTLSDGGKGGTFTPATLSLTAASQAKTFTYTPKITGAATVKATNNLGYTNPANLTYTATVNKDVVINQILYVIFKDHGYRFPFDELTRDGNISVADALTLRNSFDTYVTAITAAPTPVQHHADKAAAITSTIAHGRAGRGSGDVNADKAASIHTTTQSGRSQRGGQTEDKPGGSTVSHGR